MFKKLVPLQYDLHKDKKIKNIKGFGFAKEFHVASIMTHEFVRAAAIYPIVFIEDKKNDQFKPVVLLGLKSGENLFVDEDGKWSASYIPAIVRRYPFALAKAKDEQYLICVDEENDILNEEDGVALFNEDGKPSDAVENVKKYLGELHQMELFTTEFCKTMAQNNLFAPMNMRVRQNNKNQSISGSYVINEERLNSLSKEKFFDFQQKRYLPAIYAHLTSLAQIERLLSLSGEKSDETPQDSVERILG